jgi:hypothetical protein
VSDAVRSELELVLTVADRANNAVLEQRDGLLLARARYSREFVAPNHRTLSSARRAEILKATEDLARKPCALSESPIGPCPKERALMALPRMAWRASSSSQVWSE